MTFHYNLKITTILGRLQPEPILLSDGVYNSADIFPITIYGHPFSPLEKTPHLLVHRTSDFEKF